MKILIFATLLLGCHGQDNYNENDEYDQRPANPVPVARQYDNNNINKKETTTAIPIIKYSKEQGVDGSYKTQYETGNHIAQEETGYLKDGNDANPKGVLVQEGTFTYETPDGQVITTHYKADESGFRVHGDHLPTPPPVSPEVQKGLDEIYAGIKLLEERRAIEAKNNPKFAEEQAERDRLNYLGIYYGQ